MFEKSFLNIIRHLMLMEQVLHESVNMLKAAKQKNIDQVIFASNNRDRLVNIVTSIQQQIEQALYLSSPEYISQETLEIINCWGHDYEMIKSQVDELNDQMTKILEQEKEETTKEIATLFKNQEMIKGYNLQSTKK